VYLISEKLGVRSKDVERDIVDKAGFMLKLYSRYRKNLAEKRQLLESDDVFVWGSEKGLLLSPVDEKKFYGFLRGFVKFLQGVTEKVERQRL